MVATSTATKKAKGRKFQQEIRDIIIESFDVLEPDDVLSTSMGAGGTDIKLSPLAKRCFPFSTECKAQETVSLYTWWEQTNSNILPNTKPLLVIKKSRVKPIAVLNFNDFMDLIKENYKLKNMLNINSREGIEK